MRKRTAILLCLALLLLAGCGAETPAQTAPMPPGITAQAGSPPAQSAEPEPMPAPEPTPEPTPAPTPMPTELALTDESAEQILAYADWTQLVYVDARGSRELEALAELQRALPDCRVEWLVELQGQSYDSLDTESLALGSTEGLAEALRFLPRVAKVDLLEAEVPDEEKDALMAAFPEVDFLWWVRFGGWTFRSDISVFSTLASGAKWEHRYTSSELAPLFKYCRHLKALDLGHNDLRDLSLLGTLPELQVLILVDNPWLVDISPLAGLTQLRYLELFCCYKIVDYSCISSMTLLEDINVCHEGLLKDPAIFDGLEHLKVCWMRGVGFTWAQKQDFIAAHPEARVEFDVYEDRQSATDGGWRATEENVMIRTAFHNFRMVESFDYDEGIVFLPDSEPVWLLPTMGS